MSSLLDSISTAKEWTEIAALAVIVCFGSIVVFTVALCLVFWHILLTLYRRDRRHWDEVKPFDPTLTKSPEILT